MQQQYPVLYGTASDLLQQADCFSAGAVCRTVYCNSFVAVEAGVEGADATGVAFGVTITFTSLLFP
jgi:hypothetical protein